MTERRRTVGSGGNKKGARDSFGSIRKLPSGRFQARYTGPDGRAYRAQFTYRTKTEAQTFLAAVQTDISRDTWAPPASRAERVSGGILFQDFAESWLKSRRVKGRPLAERTRAYYQALLGAHILPTFGDVPLRYVTARMVSEWHDRMTPNLATTRARAYSLLHAIMATAVGPTGPLAGKVNPATIRGAGSATKVAESRAATTAEFETIVSAMPDRYKLLVLLACFCALRFGEITELRRTDVDLRNGLLHVRRAVVRVDNTVVVKSTKTGRGRTVAIPPHLIGPLEDHLTRHAEPGRDGLLFPARGGGHLAPSSLYKVWYPARAAAGRPDLRFHDLRGTGATWAAQNGATLAEIMGRLGHTTAAAAMRYQTVAAGRDAEIARRLSAMVSSSGPTSDR